MRRIHVALAAMVGATLLALRGSQEGRGSPPATPGPPDIEPYAPRQVAGDAPTCDPTPKLGVKLFRAAVLARFGGSDIGISRDCSIGDPSEHHEGRAWDWGVAPGPRADAMLAWLFAPDASTGEPDGVARRAGIMYAIFNRRIWRAYGARRWEPYGGANPHTDHVHLSFSHAGAAGETSFYRDLGTV